MCAGGWFAADITAVVELTAPRAALALQLFFLILFFCVFFAASLLIILRERRRGGIIIIIIIIKIPNKPAVCCCVQGEFQGEERAFYGKLPMHAGDRKCTLRLSIHLYEGISIYSQHHRSLLSVLLDPVTLHSITQAGNPLFCTKGMCPLLGSLCTSHR